MEIKNKQKPDWNILLTRNGETCPDCGKHEVNVYPKDICWATTSGLAQMYQHYEFECILNLEDKHLAYILNAFGFWVRDGHRFNAGDVVNDLFENCPVRLDMHKTGVNNMLRVVIPDSKLRWPENPDCEYPFNLQTMSLAALEKMASDTEKGTHSVS